MKNDKFKLTIQQDDEIIEKTFKTREEICSFLGVNETKLYNLLSNRIQLKHKHLAKYKDLKIEKIDIKKAKSEMIERDKNNYEVNLIKKIKEEEVE